MSTLRMLEEAERSYVVLHVHDKTGLAKWANRYGGRLLTTLRDILTAKPNELKQKLAAAEARIAALQEHWDHCPNNPAYLYKVLGDPIQGVTGKAYEAPAPAKPPEPAPLDALREKEELLVDAFYATFFWERGDATTARILYFVRAILAVNESLAAARNTER